MLFWVANVWTIKAFLFSFNGTTSCLLSPSSLSGPLTCCKSHSINTWHSSREMWFTKCCFLKYKFHFFWNQTHLSNTRSGFKNTLFVINFKVFINSYRNKKLSNNQTGYLYLIVKSRRSIKVKVGNYFLFMLI